MAKSRTKSYKELIESGNFKRIIDLFEIAPPTPVAKHLGTNASRFKKKLSRPQDFRLKEIYSIAHFFNVSEDVMLKLFHGQYMDKKPKPRKTKTA